MCGVQMAKSKTIDIETLAAELGVDKPTPNMVSYKYVWTISLSLGTFKFELNIAWSKDKW